MMNMQKLAEEVGKHAQELEELRLERQKQEVVDASIKIVTAVYSNAKAYTNVIIIAGYAAFFAMWGFVRADIPLLASLWALLLMAFSAAVFVLFEIYKMIWSAWSVRRTIFATEDANDPIGRLAEIEKSQQREAQVFGKIWIFALICTVPLGVAALTVLAVNILIVILQQA